MFLCYFFYSYTLDIPVTQTFYTQTVSPLFCKISDGSKRILVFVREHPRGCIKGLVALGILMAIRKYHHTQTQLRTSQASLEQLKKDVSALQKSHTTLDMHARENTISLQDQGRRIQGFTDSLAQMNSALDGLNKTCKMLQEGK